MTVRLFTRWQRTLLVVAPVGATAYLYTTTVGFGDPVLWVRWGYAIQYTVLVVGPLVAGLAAWKSAQVGRGDLEAVVTSTPRPALRHLVQLAAEPTLWTWVGYAATGAVLAAVVGLRATWGGPDLEMMVSTFAAVALGSCFGTAVGYGTGRVVASPVAALASWAFVVLVVDSAFDDLAPSGISLPDAFTVFHPGMDLGRALWYLAAGMALLSAAALTKNMGQPSPGERRTVWASTAVTAVLGVVLVAAPVSRSIQVEPEQYLCVGDPVEVCLHPAWERVAPAAAETVNRVVAPVVGLLDGPHRLTQVPRRTDDSLDDLTFRYSTGRRGFSRTRLAAIVARRLTADGCETPVEDDPTLAVTGWLLRAAGFESDFLREMEVSPVPDEVAETYLLRLWGSGTPDCSVVGDLPPIRPAA